MRVAVVCFLVMLGMPAFADELVLDPIVEGEEVQAVSNDVMYKVSFGYTEPRFAVNLSRSYDGGQTWEEPRVVYTSPLIRAPMVFPKIIASGSAVAIGFEYIDGGLTPPNIISSADWGDTFYPVQERFEESSYQSKYDMAFSNGRLLWIWDECQYPHHLCFSSTEPEDIRISFGNQKLAEGLILGGPDRQFSLKLDVSGDDIYASWKIGQRRFLRHATIVPNAK